MGFTSEVQYNRPEIMEEDFVIKTKALIARDFELEIGDEPLTEEELFKILADEVAYMIDHRLDFLLSLLYRLDVLEHKINAALGPWSTLPPNIALAQLIMERQKQRIITKSLYKPKESDDLEGLEF